MRRLPTNSGLMNSMPGTFSGMASTFSGVIRTGLPLRKPLPGERRPRGEDEDDALPHAVEPLDLGLGDGVAEGDQQDDRERPPDDSRQRQGRPQRLADQVAEEVAEEDAII